MRSLMYSFVNLMVQPSRFLLAGVLTLSIILSPGWVERSWAETGFDGEAPIVTSIELRSDAKGLSREGLMSQVEIEVGEPLHERAIERTLRNLVASGVGSDVRILKQRNDQGVDITVVVIADYRVDSIKFQGNLGMKRARFLPLVEQKVGSALYEDRLLRSVFALQDFYEEQSYRRASVRLEVDLEESRKLAYVLFRIDSGERASLKEIEFEGDLGPFESEQMLEQIKARVGGRENRQELRDDQARLAGWLRQEGYLQAEVDEAVTTYDSGSDSVDVTFPVRVGPRVEVVVQGADLEKLAKEGLLPYLGEAGYDQALVSRADQQVRDHFQTRGFYKATVESRQETVGEGEDESVRVVIDIKKGLRYVVEAVLLEGNETFPAKQLDPLIQTSKRAFLAAGSGIITAENLEADQRNLRAFYLLSGFADVVVGPAQIEIGDESEGAAEPIPLRITIPIVEGRRRLVSSLEFDGFEALNPQELELSVLEVGGPFHQQRLDDMVDLIRSRYDKLGFERAVVTPVIETSDEGRLVDVTVRVLEGPKSVIDRVVIRGNLRTRTSVVNRVLALQAGEPLSRARLLEAQRRLYQLGVFSRASVSSGPRRDSSQGQSEGASQDVVLRDVVVRVEEGRRWRLGYGVSFDSEDDFGGLFSANYLNFGGRASNLRLDLRANENEQRYRLLFTDRSIGRGVTPLSYSVYRVNEVISEFDSTRFGFQLEAARFFGDLRASVFYDYRSVQLENISAIVPILETSLPEDITRDLVDVEISSITSTLQIDRRDDPINPTRGWGSTLQFEQAFSLFGATEQFQKLFFQGTNYMSVGSLGVLAASLRLGAISPADPTVGVDNPVPISERFFGGGRTTHRAFERDELGVRDQTVFSDVAVGGNGLALLNLDYRFRVAGPLGGIVFVDGGNIWLDWDDIDPSEVRWGAGVGVRYLSPVGPLRLEIGWKLDREVGEDRYEILFSFGNAF